MNRNVSRSDDAGAVEVAQARRETQAAKQPVIALTVAEEREFWQALPEPTALAAAQQALGGLLRGA